MFFSALPRLPVPVRLFGTLDAYLPTSFKRSLVEPFLNHVFAEPLAEGEFDSLENRRISLSLEDLNLVLTLEMRDRRLMVSDVGGEATIRGGWREFFCLAMRREDPDSLFFQRRLIIEGDTELGLMVKNLLDSREEGIVPAQVAAWLERFEAFSGRRHR